MLGIVLATSVLVFRPLRNCVDLIRKDYEIPLKGAYEVRFLAKNYNLMYYTTKENEKVISLNELTVLYIIRKNLVVRAYRFTQRKMKHKHFENHKYENTSIERNGKLFLLLIMATFVKNTARYEK